MLHLPESHPRGLLQKAPRPRSDGQFTLTYAYPFYGCDKLEIPPTRAPGRPDRPREIMPKDLFLRLQAAGVLQFLQSYDAEHGEGAAMRRRPTFSILQRQHDAGNSYA